MLLKTTSRFSGEKSQIVKFWLIIICLTLISLPTLAQNGWTKKMDMPHRGGGGSCIYENKLYVIGGSDDGPSFTSLKYNQVYDPATNIWEEKTPVPSGHNFHSVVCLNDTIYVIGGGYPTQNLKIEAYHPATDTWKTKKNMPRVWRSSNAVVLEDKIYMFGGNYNQHECYSYDPITEEWTKKTPIPSDGGGVTATIVYNGLIYCFGGSNYSPWSAKSTVYAYNPQTDKWTKKQDMPTARFAFKTYLLNGKIYAIGGSRGQSNSLRTVEVYDPIGDSWKALSDMPNSTAWFSGEVVNNKIYIIGGTANWNTVKSEVWEYDPTQDPIAQNGWIQKFDIPTRRVGATAATVDGKIYLIGGWVTAGHHSKNEMYDPLTNTWTIKTSMPSARGFLTSVVVDGIIYTIGGGYPTATAKMEAYNPALDTWETKASMNESRTNGRAALFNGKIYVFGGYQRRTCEFYDPQTDSWALFKELPTDAGGISAVAEYNGLIYVCGGGYQPGLKSVYAYDPLTDSYSKKCDMLGQRTVAQACVINDNIYVIGGARTYHQSTDAVEIYNPATDTWSSLSPMPVKSAFLSCVLVNNKIYTFEGSPDWSTGGLRTWEFDPSLDPLVSVELKQDEASKIISEFSLSQNYPNPFNPSTTIKYSIPTKSNVILKVYDVLGREVSTLVNELKAAGNYEIKFDASELTSGIYFYKLKSNNLIQSKKMLVLK